MSDKAVVNGMLAGKVVVITGAGRGIGKACVAVCVREGAKVLAVDFSGDEKIVAAEAGPDVVAFHADVSVEHEIEAVFAAALAAFGRVDASLHVAGTMAGKQGDDFSLSEYERLTSTNLRGVMLLCKYAAEAMKPGGGGSIVNVTSVAGINGEHLAALSYTAAKTAVHGISKVLAIEYAPHGIRVNVVASGFTLTETFLDFPADVVAMMSAKPALGRPASASEQAEVLAFLASPRASYVTGTIIPVDGGWTARLV